ncbi:MAG: hypothetical protein FWG94_06000, partial [Oscillospiraceae bacterium]|nr:hypothetical protein [Oscillospiraceae bacterium]
SFMRQNLLLLFNAVGRPAFILAKGGFLVSKDFLSSPAKPVVISAEAIKRNRAARLSSPIILFSFERVFDC